MNNNNNKSILIGAQTFPWFIKLVGKKIKKKEREKNES